MGRDGPYPGIDGCHRGETGKGGCVEALDLGRGVGILPHRQTGLGQRHGDRVVPRGMGGDEPAEVDLAAHRIGQIPLDETQTVAQPVVQTPRGVARHELRRHDRDQVVHHHADADPLRRGSPETGRRAGNAPGAVEQDQMVASLSNGVERNRRHTLDAGLPCHAHGPPAVGRYPVAAQPSRPAPPRSEIQHGAVKQAFERLAPIARQHLVHALGCSLDAKDARELRCIEHRPRGHVCQGKRPDRARGLVSVGDEDLVSAPLCRHAGCQHHHNALNTRKMV